MWESCTEKPLHLSPLRGLLWSGAWPGTTSNIYREDTGFCFCEDIKHRGRSYPVAFDHNPVSSARPGKAPSVSWGASAPAAPLALSWGGGRSARPRRGLHCPLPPSTSSLPGRGGARGNALHYTPVRLLWAVAGFFPAAAHLRRALLGSVRPCPAAPLGPLPRTPRPPRAAQAREALPARSAGGPRQDPDPRLTRREGGAEVRGLGRTSHRREGPGVASGVTTVDGPRPVHARVQAGPRV